MGIKTNPSYRLNLFWGKVDQKQIATFLPYVKVGGNVLDMGCGLGNTMHHLLKLPNTKVTGIDFDANEVKMALEIFPNLNIVVANAENMPFENESFDTIVLKDSLHHFYEETDFEKVKKEIDRILKPGGTLIYLDPNVNAMIRFLRRQAKHVDAECDFEAAMESVKSLGYKVQKTRFNTLYSLPLSGGYVYKNFIPHSPLLYKVLLGIENFFELPVNWLKLGRFICWRYLIVSQKP